MENRKILVWSDTPEDLRFAHAAGLKLGVPVEGPMPIEEALAKARASREARIFANVSSDDRLRQFLKAFEAAPESKATQPIEPNRVHLIGSVAVKDFEQLCDESVFEHFILPGSNNPELAGHHYGVTLKQFLDSKEPRSEELAAPGFNYELLRSSDRGKAIESLNTYLTDKLEVSSRIAAVMLNAVDELLMNAIFDAPKDDSGNQLYRNLPRTEDFALSDSSKVELSLRQDGDYLIFTSTDFFGTLDKHKLFQKFFKNHRDKNYALDTSVENAGLGLATTFESGGSLLFYSQRRVKTQVSVIYRYTKSYRELAAQFRYLSVHLSKSGNS